MDPLSHIEDRRAQTDIGVFAARIYAGALAESGSRRRAFTVLVAWFKAMLISDERAAGEDE